MAIRVGKRLENALAQWLALPEEHQVPEVLFAIAKAAGVKRETASRYLASFRAANREKKPAGEQPA